VVVDNIEKIIRKSSHACTCILVVR